MGNGNSQGHLIYNDVQEVPLDLAIGEAFCVAVSFFDLANGCTAMNNHSLKVLSVGCSN